MELAAGIKKDLDNADYAKLSDIKRAVDRRIQYNDTGKNEWRYVPKNETSSGDCQVFAQTYEKDARDAGFEPIKKLGRVGSKNVVHTWVTVGEQSMDCRFPGRLIREVDGGYKLLIGE